MLSAFAVSCVFLACYLVYHYHVGSVRFQGPPAVRAVYLTILATHVVLAATVPFLAGMTIYLALRNHRHSSRTLDAADMALCLGHGRRHFRDAVSPLPLGPGQSYNSSSRKGRAERARPGARRRIANRRRFDN